MATSPKPAPQLAIDLAVDTSALTAVLLGEPEAAAILHRLTTATRPGLCAPNRTELL
ncbi:MAG: type II toxin-antitoxin system VapC family toxin [Thiocapsa sp.]|uniref:type II toxin-antitoxin system VapC family toxin n=1 Tax=Thiocapsa sp. TaxID=2024551 RepID=UPI001BD0EA93|nr:type II toxin-antitoxin system VapC family toxin [Thiocapsa sp.]QVL47794.1 MAG: type II toxin-antitoxin system VapC family toxin [Thiocapsa sp.]